MNDDVRPMTPPNGGTDMMRALIMGGTLGCHGAVSQPATIIPALPLIPQPVSVPNAFPVAPKRPLPPPTFPAFPVALEHVPKRLRLGDGPWKHAGLMSEFGGVKMYLRMVKGEVPWPPRESDSS